MTRTLPVADAATVRRHIRALLVRHRPAIAGAVGLNALAAAPGLVTPRLLGDLVEAIAHGATARRVDLVALAIVVLVVAQALLTRVAHLVSARLGERTLSDLREGFMDRVLALPLGTVERAGGGDLLTRASRDVSSLSYVVRYALPETLVCVVIAVLIVAALVLVSPLLAAPCLLAAPVLWAGTRWYLRRAPAGYLRESARYGEIIDGLSETVDGARTVEALDLAGVRRDRTDGAIRGSYAAERYTLFLRSVWWPTLELGYVLPVAATLLLGSWSYTRGWVGLSEVTAATLYSHQLVGPLDRLLFWLDEIEVGRASLARLLGVGEGPGEPPVTARRPVGNRIVAAGVHFAYTPGRDVLRGISLAVEPGERLAIVGPSGAGKSTLCRLLAGIHMPTAGTVTVGGVPLAALELAERRRHVALVTQEFHLFLGTLWDNVTMADPTASDDRVRAALDAVHATPWVRDLPDGLRTPVGAGALPLSPAQAQQVALARLVLTDPHTVVLDEATAMLDPRSARDLERSLAAVLRGRAVIAIAHRLHSAHDADRIAVVRDGAVVELGGHRELIAADGSYAALWRSWHGQRG